MVSTFTERLQEEKAGRIFKIQRYCIGDGPGIRTTVFFAGCSLRCLWCHNPEAFVSPEAKLDVGRSIELPREVTLEQVMKPVLADRAYYSESGGGATLSGGEPLMQPQFAFGLIEACHAENIPVYLETCGHAAPEVFEQVASEADGILFDIKHMNPARHRELTGVDNDLIQINLARAVALKTDLRVRMTVIPGQNDDDGNYQFLADRLKAVGYSGAVELHPYHGMGLHKYESLGLDYPLKGLLGPAEGDLKKVKRKLIDLGVDAKVCMEDKK